MKSLYLNTRSFSYLFYILVSGTVHTRVEVYKMDLEMYRLVK